MTDWDDLVRNSEGDLPDLPPDELWRVWRKSRPMRWLRAALWMVAAIVVFVLFVIAINLAIGKARAHSWYDVGCCDTADCHPQEPGELVRLTAAGWQIDIAAQGIHDLVVFDDKRLRDTPMDATVPFHICIWPHGTLRCFYRPGAAG